ncbi:hypothetical protein BZA70DRAFT_105820 [Myxozyma melibiosi]|uniref:Uncharacterized protein n=1 Tax=Myxozyma melibiosi TaxID=54550 RepID=A0ABR1FBJ5_9ASCO
MSFLLCCCAPRKPAAANKSLRGARADPPPAYYSDFNFYAEQLRDRELGRFNDDESDGDSDGEGEEEFTALLRARRGDGQQTSLRSHWFTSCLGRQKQYVSLISSITSFCYCINTFYRHHTVFSTLPNRKPPSLISTESLAGILNPSTSPSSPRRVSTSTPVSGRYDLPSTASAEDPIEDFGLADAQLVPDSFVVSVPLRDTKPSHSDPASAPSSPQSAVTDSAPPSVLSTEDNDSRQNLYSMSMYDQRGFVSDRTFSGVTV